MLAIRRHFRRLLTWPYSPWISIDPPQKLINFLRETDHCFSRERRKKKSRWIESNTWQFCQLTRVDFLFYTINRNELLAFSRSSFCNVEFNFILSPFRNLNTIFTYPGRSTISVLRGNYFFFLNNSINVILI